MKTAMQELIDEINHVFRNNRIDHVTQAVDDIIEIINNKALEKEKEQIMNDYRKGKGDLFMFYKDLGFDKTAEEYYNQTYNENK